MKLSFEAIDHAARAFVVEDAKGMKLQERPAEYNFDQLTDEAKERIRRSVTAAIEAALAASGTLTDEDALEFTEALLVDAYMKSCNDLERATAWAKYDVARIRDGDYVPARSQIAASGTEPKYGRCANLNCVDPNHSFCGGAASGTEPTCEHPGETGPHEYANGNDTGYSWCSGPASGTEPTREQMLCVRDGCGKDELHPIHYYSQYGTKCHGYLAERRNRQ